MQDGIWIEFYLVDREQPELVALQFFSTINSTISDIQNVDKGETLKSVTAAGVFVLATLSGCAVVTPPVQPTQPNSVSAQKSFAQTVYWQNVRSYMYGIESIEGRSLRYYVATAQSHNNQLDMRHRPRSSRPNTARIV